MELSPLLAIVFSQLAPAAVRIFKQWLHLIGQQVSAWLLQIPDRQMLGGRVPIQEKMLVSIFLSVCQGSLFELDD